MHQNVKCKKFGQWLGSVNYPTPLKGLELAVGSMIALFMGVLPNVFLTMALGPVGWIPGFFIAIFTFGYLTESWRRDYETLLVEEGYSK